MKSIVFMTYWQGLAVTIIPGVPSDERNKWEVGRCVFVAAHSCCGVAHDSVNGACAQNFVLCIEMVLFAILHICAFNYRGTASARAHAAALWRLNLAGSRL